MGLTVISDIDNTLLRTENSILQYLSNIPPSKATWWHKKLYEKLLPRAKFCLTNVAEYIIGEGLKADHFVLLTARQKSLREATVDTLRRLGVPYSGLIMRHDEDEDWHNYKLVHVAIAASANDVIFFDDSVAATMMIHRELKKFPNRVDIRLVVGGKYIIPTSCINESFLGGGL